MGKGKGSVANWNLVCIVVKVGAEWEKEMLQTESSLHESVLQIESFAWVSRRENKSFFYYYCKLSPVLHPLIT